MRFINIDKKVHNNIIKLNRKSKQNVLINKFVNIESE